MYQALYRKYRPQVFDDVVGQSHITDTLKAQLQGEKMSHAYLFTGTRGTGKTTCAKILAKAVNCTNLHDGNPCNCCPSCRSIDSGSCVDVLEIDAASNNGVDHVRALRDEAIYSPGEVKKRVYIVDEVHMLSTAAFNALLKIIEEPPAHLLFILATTELHKVPATILSRCQRFSFRRLQAGDIEKRLHLVAYEEGIDLSPEAAEQLAVLADGALRDGLSLLDQCASATTSTVTADTVASVLGLAGEKKVAELFTKIATGDTHGVLTEFSALYEAGKDLSAMLSEMSTLARDLLLMRTAPNSGKGMLSSVCRQEEREKLVKLFSAPQLLHMVSLLQKTASNFAVSVSPRLDAELCLMELCNPALSQDVRALSARVGKLEEQLATGAFVTAPIPTPAQVAPAPAEQPAPTAELPTDAPAPKKETPPAPANDDTLPADFWAEFRGSLKADLHEPYWSLLAQFTPTLKNGILSLEGPAFAVATLQGADQNLFSQKASALLHRPITVKITGAGEKRPQGDDPLKDLLQFGANHEDIFTITK
ncbi:MAG: DNA polymerase III subunit gamma/tau [Oscillospiraceae bacterium]|nr:DNA polymerase III subunit gamma/tau [Oscillospiraceae bacterium]